MHPRALELLRLIETLLVGRVVLSMLPPGRLGSHRPDRIAATLSASLVLGFAVDLVVELPHAVLGLPSLPPRVLAVIAIPVALARWLTLPGAFVPSPFPWVDPPSLRAVAARCASVAAIVAGLFYAARAPLPDSAWDTLLLMQHLPYLALPALLDHALRQIDVPPGPRTWIWVVLALLIWVLPPAIVLHGALPWIALLLGSGTAFLLVWRRNADRRALALSALAFGASTCSAPAVWPLGLGGLVWLVLATPGGSRKLARRWALAAALLLGPVAFAERSRLRAMHIDRADLVASPPAPGVTAILVATALPIALIALVLWRTRRTHGAALT